MGYNFRWLTSFQEPRESWASSAGFIRRVLYRSVVITVWDYEVLRKPAPIQQSMETYFKKRTMLFLIVGSLLVELKNHQGLSKLMQVHLSAPTEKISQFQSPRMQTGSQ